MKVAVLISCYNRKNKTVKCINEFRKYTKNSGIHFDIHLTDDGCTDGTSEAVREVEPTAEIYAGGNLFWAGGMRKCWQGAFSKGGYDYYLLLNDDTFVNEYFIPDFLECCKIDNKAIICGNICNSTNTEGTYVSIRIISKLPYVAERIGATGKPEYISFCGANIMWVPSCVVEKQGTIPPIYVHSIADLDICMRAQKNGFKVLGTSHYCGYCAADHAALSPRQLCSMTLKERWNYLWSPKGIALKQWIYYQYEFFPWRVPGVIARAIVLFLFGKQ